MASGADALVRAGPPGPALSMHSKYGPTRASAAVQGTAPPLAFVTELRKQDTSLPSSLLCWRAGSNSSYKNGLTAFAINCIKASTPVKRDRLHRHWSKDDLQNLNSQQSPPRYF